jgi:hypothetical protein
MPTRLAEAIEVSVRDGENILDAVLHIAAGDECEITLEISGEPPLTSVGSDFFEAMNGVRLVLESKLRALLCQGCSQSVYPSQMLRQSSRGRRAYVLTMPRSSLKPQVVDIFSPMLDTSLWSTVAEQEQWFELWAAS